ncbi:MULTISPECIES: Cof-type HAD-IIB family hydrolase [unclassified Corynebacterium]|uniref:Cof-type HAD-IIB family hydrolase n=1 Tax=unclassified Corynebacterium TaxID=2624378 RepID=UPI0029C9E896|nr:MULTISPECIES: Cof-type HAD-IIB family hydrolase [unclassified Corynebacterium]WPF66813.1 Cof-type HAD-IIB family hydrolase [Corynebacterium sp. 22KM0430]WPF69301.1 Cof-type HAD-IIB family hydrolase [Corynebacterium sp. 21KM1197]
MERRLVAVDMDGTFLDGQGKIPERFWDFYPRLAQAGIVLVPASGRQLATLRDLFGPLGAELDFIAENGTVVYAGGKVVSTTPMREHSAHALIDAAATAPTRMELVVCTPTMAYVNRPDILDEVAKYYHRVRSVTDLHEAVDDTVIKIALYSEADAETHALPLLKAAAPEEQPTLSGKHWVDVMSPEATKGRALSQLSEALGIPIERTIAFGDYLNDLEMLRTAGTAYAMSNAHPLIKEVADHIAPPNTEAGVLTVLEELLG